MKTTIELPDELLIAAKRRAAELRRPLRELVEEGLRARLETGAAARSRKVKRIRWITAAGGVPAEVDLSSRADMQEWLTRR